MEFKGPIGKEINRFGFKLASDQKGLMTVDLETLRKRFTETNEEGIEVISKEPLDESDKKELLSAIKAYGFSTVIAEKAEKADTK